MADWTTVVIPTLNSPLCQVFTSNDVKCLPRSGLASKRIHLPTYIGVRFSLNALMPSA